MTAIEIILWLIVSACASGAVFYKVGFKAGRDAQWVDDIIEHGRREAQRRDKRGRFKKQ